MFSVLPLIKAGEISMFFPWGGHKEFRNSNLKYIINGLGYLEPQLKTIVYEVINVQKLPRVAIFHADDDFSTEAAQIITDVFKKQNVTPIGIVSYNRFTVDIKRASQKLIDLDPKIIISLGTSTPTVRLINNFFEKGYYDTKFIGIDSTLFVNRILKSRGINYTFTSSVPDPIESELSIVKEYRQNINNFCPDETYNILSLAYYVSAAIVVQAIKNCVGTITKEKIISNIEKMQDESIGGYKVTFNLSNRHAFGSNILLVRG
jgi:ABC-type branched-subunit amino acid transport system substrate-binding protein